MEQQGMVYLVMELCQTSLGRWLDNNGGKGMEMRQLAKVALDICTSLAQLHACGIVHCDIKPENCLVRGDGTVVLCDFGSSKVLEKTVMSTLAFTLAYSCLEQLSTRAGPGCRADPRWDVYSVAATLAELATGKKPFADTPPAMVAVEHAMGRTLQHMNLDQVPDDKLREILRQCLGPISSRPSLAGLQSMLVGSGRACEDGCPRRWTSWPPGTRGVQSLFQQTRRQCRLRLRLSQLQVLCCQQARAPGSGVEMIMSVNDVLEHDRSRGVAMVDVLYERCDGPDCAPGSHLLCHLYQPQSPWLRPASFCRNFLAVCEQVRRHVNEQSLIPALHIATQQLGMPNAHPPNR